MSLSDVVGNAGLAVWAEAGLVIFFGAFVLVALRVLTRPRDEMRRHAFIPLDDPGPGENR
ncbi:MAG: hypothetical protein DYG93_04865 [Leptolyngbya sp. PLA2]|nr:hypothetical protein [Leptolyngbya sp.]MCE7970977.1 hypothetical protein [Leptolyngbya sp. PL-A2]MCZ7631952.1 hypothetical protein [Phycisphaerales bacterium]MDL1905288.1 hypothetical protein [Synechococcales cyanobacterium CNB]GIK20243.1 MAG: hypothetical protein BroJett004_24070 [Planctomycetota bacterium]